MKIDANGITLDAALFGTPGDTPLVLIRGLGSQRVHWAQELIDGFVARGHRVVTFDNRDVGGSRRCSDTPAGADDILAMIAEGRDLPVPYTLDDMARDVTGLMDALDIGRAHVFGISLGGIITQRLICDHADRLLSAMVVMSPARLRDPSRAGELLVRDLDREAYIKNEIRTEAQWGSPDYPAPETWTRGVAARAWDRGADADGVNRQLLAAFATENRIDDLAQAKVPTLVIHGRDDTLVPWQAGHEIAETIPGAEWELIEGMGHIITPALAPVIVERVARFIGAGPG